MFRRFFVRFPSPQNGKNPSIPGMNVANGLEHKRPIFFYKFTLLIAVVTRTATKNTIQTRWF